MKKSILAGALAVALFAIPVVSACSASSIKVNGKNFNVADYAISIDKYSNTVSSRKAPTAMTTLAYSEIERIDSSKFASARGTGEHNYEYQLYNVQTGSALLGGKWYDSIDYVGYCYDWDGDSVFFKLSYYDRTVYQYRYDYCDATGTAIVEGADSYVSTAYKSYSNVYLYSFEYSKDGEYATKYFSYTRTADDTRSWKSITEDEYNNYSENDDGGYKVGDQLGFTKTPVCDEEGSSRTDYSYSEESGSAITTYTFYNKENKTGSVSIENGEEIGFAGDYFFFMEATPVSAEATKGYNVETVYNSAVTKANVKLYRYNYVKGGSKKEVKMDGFVVLEGSSLYNYATGNYGMLVVTAVKTTNGIAVATAAATTYTLVLDENGKVSADLSDKSVGTSFYKLSATRFLSGKSILDEKLNTIAQLPSNPSVWKEQNLLVCNSYNDTLFIDYNGKIAMLADYSYNSRYFFNNAYVNASNGVIYTTSNPEGIRVDELVECREDEQLSTNYLYCGVILKFESADRGYNCTFYDLTGKSIGKENNLYSRYLSSATIGDKSFITYEVYENGSYTTKTVELF